MPSSAGPPEGLTSDGAVLAETNAQLGRRFRWQRQLPGGEQSGAHVVVQDDQVAVLKWERAGWKADQLLRAFPVVVHATQRGWPAARWLAAGRLVGGGAFVLQEYVDGIPMSVLGVESVEAVVAANATQAGLGIGDATDDSAQLEAVLSGDHPWKRRVARFTAAGAALVEHGDEVVRWTGGAAIPVADVVHGDYSSSNILLGLGEPTITFVDCQTLGRGSRVRDLADLYRQSYLYPSPANLGSRLLRAAGIAAEGPEIFAECAVAVSYNNLAWWVENKPAAEFDQACVRLHRLFDDLRRLPTPN